VVISNFTSKDSSSAPAPKEETKTFDEVADRDKQFLNEPAVVGEIMTGQEQEPATEQQPTQETPQQEPTPEPVQPEPVQPAQSTSQYTLPSSITEPTTLYFKPMSEIDDIEAQRLLPYATAGRSIGRLPVMQYGLMVKACRQIEDRWPDSWYAFRAKQLLEEIYERYAANYKITEQELDISRFLEPRQGTEPRRVEPVQR
jgi:hypothetical protein